MKIKSRIPKSPPFKVFNGLRTPDGTLLVSSYTHDYQSYTDKNGKWYMLDGGLEDYFRSSMNGDEEFIALYSNSPHEKLREYLGRSGKGKDGQGEWRFTLLKDMSDEHLENTIKYTKNLIESGMNQYKWYLKFYKTEKQYRQKNNIKINENIS